MKKAFVLILVAKVCAAQLVNPPILNTGSTPVLPATRYDVVLNYHASGSSATTTGTISLGSPNILTVADASTYNFGDGVWVSGAVTPTTPNPLGNLISTVVSRSGNALTLADNATVGVTGAAVKHSDCAAANAAMADAYGHGGGTVFFRHTGVDGVYVMNCLADPATGGILTLPQNIAYIGPTALALIGEDPTVYLDFTNAPNVSGNSAYSTAPYVQATSGSFDVFEPVYAIVDNLNIGLPVQTKLNGLMFSNALQAAVGDNVSIAPAPDSPGVWNIPTGASTGIWMPQAYNNVNVSIGHAKVAFFDKCLVPGEHGTMGSPYLYGCLHGGIYLYSYNHAVEGSARIESSPNLVRVDSAASSAVPVDFHIDGEGYGTGWNTRVQDIVDPNGRLMGYITYGMYAAGSGSNGFTYLTRGGGALNVSLKNTANIALYGAAAFPIYTCNADTQNSHETVFDATTPTFLGTYVPGGGVLVDVLCNGTNWVTH